MTTQVRPNPDRSVVSRSIYGILLALAVLALLIFAARLAFPSGSTGIEREPAEDAPVGQGTPR